MKPHSYHYNCPCSLCSAERLRLRIAELPPPRKYNRAGDIAPLKPVVTCKPYPCVRNGQFVPFDPSTHPNIVSYQ